VSTPKQFDIWWWLSTPFGVLFPFVIILFGLRQGAGEALGVFLLASLACTCSAVVWSFVTIARKRQQMPNSAVKLKLAFVALAVALWLYTFLAPPGGWIDRGI
jgi:hypothetical protein